MCVNNSPYEWASPAFLCKKLSRNTLFVTLLLFFTNLVSAQGPNPQTGMRVIGMINLSSSCEKDTLKMENLTKDSAKTVKYYIHDYNYFNDPIYPHYRDTIYTKANGAHVYDFDDSMVLATCYRSVNVYFGIIAVDTFGLDYPVISRITIFLKPRAIFTTDSVICAGGKLSITNLSCKDSTKFKWFYNDTVSTATTPPSVKFDKSGRQVIKMIANTTAPCAQTDTISKIVNVLKVPEPAFKFLRPSMAAFTDSVICIGDTLLLVDTSKYCDSIHYTFNPPNSFSLLGGSTMNDDTVRLLMVNKGDVIIHQEGFNRACSRTSRKAKLTLINNPIIAIKPLPGCIDTLGINLDDFVDTSNGIPLQVIWKISGNSLDKTINTLYPGAFGSLSYGRYYVSVTSIGACKTITNRDSFFISPKVKSPDPIHICKNADTMINLNTLFTLPKGFRRKWSGAITNDSFFHSKGKTPGTYILTLTDLNSTCYTLDVKVEILGGAAPLPGQHLCYQDKAFLNLDELLPADYSGKGVRNDTFRSALTGPGKYKAYYVNTIKSCVFNDSLDISVHDTFTPDFDFITPACQDSPVLFRKKTPEPIVRWEFGDGSFYLVDPASHTYGKPGTYNVKLVARTHCPDSTIKPITIYPGPSARLNVISDTLNCDSVIITAYFTNKGYGETYTVSCNNISYSGDSVRMAVPKSFQPRYIGIYGTASSKCGTSLDSARIRIPQRSYAAIELLGLNPGCHGDTLKLVNTSYGPIDSFRVDYGNGKTSLNKVLRLPYFNNTTSLKDYHIILTAYMKYCGILKDTATYKVIPNVIRAAGEHNKKSLCNYEMVTFINNSTEGTEYNLYFGDGGSSKGTVFHQTVTYQYMIPGVYVPYIKAVSACGSDSVSLDTIRVNGAPSVYLSRSRTKMCLGSEIYLKYSPSNLMHPKWFVNHVLADSLVNPFVFRPRAIGKYRITVMASNQYCVGLDSFEISVESAPDIKIDVNEVTCDTMRVKITGNYSLGTLEVNWGDGITDFGKLYHVYHDTGLYLVKILLVEGLCTLYFEREIMVKSKPHMKIRTQPLLTDCLDPGDTLNMFIELDSMPYQVDIYNWAGEAICLNCDRIMPDIKYRNCDPKQFRVVVKDKDMCKVEKEVSFTCFDQGSNKYKAFIPNAFTPKNGDLLNDIYMPELPYYDEGMVYNLRIFNRWGEKVFETSDPSVGWDGTFKGRVCEMDVYVYIIEYGCPSHRYNEHRGTFHLLR